MLACFQLIVEDRLSPGFPVEHAGAGLSSFGGCGLIAHGPCAVGMIINELDLRTALVDLVAIGDSCLFPGIPSIYMFFCAAHPHSDEATVRSANCDCLYCLYSRIQHSPSGASALALELQPVVPRLLRKEYGVDSGAVDEAVNEDNDGDDVMMVMMVMMMLTIARVIVLSRSSRTTMAM